MNAQTDEITLNDWYALYIKCTPQEREELLIEMLIRIENRRQAEAVEIYRLDTSLLAGLTVSALRDVASQAVENAHRWILSNSPDVAGFINSYECLYSFTVGKDETVSHMDLADVIASLKELWSYTATETKPTATTETR